MIEPFFLLLEPILINVIQIDLPRKSETFWDVKMKYWLCGKKGKI